MFGSFKRALFEGVQKTFLTDLSQGLKAGGEGQGSGGKCRFARRIGSQIEGTDIQAIVATEDTVAHLSRELVGNDSTLTTQFDG